MGKIGKGVGVTSFFATATAGVFAGEAIISAEKQQEIRECYTEGQPVNPEYCEEKINQGYDVYRGANLLEFGGLIGTIAGGIAVWYALTVELDKPDPAKYTPVQAGEVSG